MFVNYRFINIFQDFRPNRIVPPSFSGNIEVINEIIFIQHAERIGLHRYGLSNVSLHSQFELTGAKVCKCVLLLEINNVSTNFLSLHTLFILYHLPVFSRMEETLLLNRESPTPLDIDYSYMQCWRRSRFVMWQIL